ncbi:hypothetical protein BDV59DRAFT_168795 [Aspergillus ambiguus]|uniref:uncharacterized protein n=1 Tax=Aspergillus ambiguus TaxID=176160 RepID=UPI003CCDDAF8
MPEAYRYTQYSVYLRFKDIQGLVFIIVENISISLSHFWMKRNGTIPIMSTLHVLKRYSCDTCRKRAYKV